MDYVKPGWIQIQVEDGVCLDCEDKTGESTLGFVGPDGEKLDELQQLVGGIELQRQWRSFDEPTEGSSPGWASKDSLSPLDRFHTLEFSAGTDVVALAAEVSRLRGVAAAAAVPLLQPAQFDPDVDPTGQDHHKQWYLARCNALAAWQSVRGRGATIVDLDWGFKTDHPDLEVARSHNAIDQSSDVGRGPHVGHGTAALGMAGARQNGRGIQGFAPEATLWAVQAGKSEEIDQDPETWQRALKWAADTVPRPAVLLLEVQTKAFSNAEKILALNGAIRSLVDQPGIVICIAAGNGNRPADRDERGQKIPASGAVVVGATVMHKDLPAPSSNCGVRVGVWAPGDVRFDLSTWSHPLYKSFGRTSGAVAKVAGAVALMLEANHGLTTGDVRQIFNPHGHDRAPLLDCARSVAQARS